MPCLSVLSVALHVPMLHGERERKSYHTVMESSTALVTLQTLLNTEHSGETSEDVWVITLWAKKAGDGSIGFELIKLNHQLMWRNMNVLWIMAKDHKNKLQGLIFTVSLLLNSFVNLIVIYPVLYSLKMWYTIYWNVIIGVTHFSDTLKNLLLLRTVSK